VIYLLQVLISLHLKAVSYELRVPLWHVEQQPA